MQGKSLAQCAQVAIRAAKEAGVLLAKHVGAPAKVETKRSAVDLVTEIDRGSEVIIRRILERSYPDFGFRGEEQGRFREDSPYQWIVDPLDGTMNFVHGLPFFGISIGLAYKGTPIAGVIYDPCRKEMFSAARKQGAFLNGKKMSASRTRRLGRSILATGFSSDFRSYPEPYLSWFKTFETRSHAVRRIGSTALCMAYVAAGRLDGFYEDHLWPWDVAAGILLIQEAGGTVTDLRGNTPQIQERGGLVASNKGIHREVLKTLHQASARSRRKPTRAKTSLRNS